MELKHIAFSKTRISDQVKEVLKEAVLNLKPGDKIPSEEDITRQLNVSMVTVRAALGGLEAEGLVERRRGVFGGSFVAMPSSGKMGEVVMNYYRMGDVTPEDLVEFRSILEPTLAELAAERWTDEELEALKRVIDEYEDILQKGILTIRKPALEFHYLIADICHNSLISHVMRALAIVFEKILASIPQNMDDLRSDLDYSKQLYDCFVRRDSKKAREIMAAHFITLKSIIERSRIIQTVDAEEKVGE